MYVYIYTYIYIYIYSILQYIIWWEITKQHGHLKKKKMIELNRPFSPSNNVRYNLRLQHGVNDMYINVHHNSQVSN